MSGPPPIPDEVRRFVLTSVPAVPYLEAMLLLHGARGVDHSVDNVSARLYITVEAAREILDALCASGVVSNDNGRYRYAPTNETLAALVDSVASTYAANLIGITNLLHDQTHRTALRFADAFKLRKK